MWSPLDEFSILGYNIILILNKYSTLNYIMFSFYFLLFVLIKYMYDKTHLIGIILKNNTFIANKILRYAYPVCK